MYGGDCATVFFVLQSDRCRESDSEEDDGEPPLEIDDPGRPFKRLLQAVLLAAVMDFSESPDRQTHNQAKAFLFPESNDRQEYLRLLIQSAGLCPRWFGDELKKLRHNVKAPERQAASAARYAVKRRVQDRCGWAG